jgi:sugar lactone lactonase YvrE
MLASWRKAVEVPRYFLHLRFQEGADGLALDEEGDEVSNLSALQAHVEVTARDLMRHTRLAAIPDWHTCTFEVTDEAGQLVLTLPFSNLRGKGT